jgi:hypothetical protein
MHIYYIGNTNLGGGFMFGHDDNQQSQQPVQDDNSGMLQAAMPDPIPGGDLSDTSVAPSTGVVNPTSAPAVQDSGTPELPSFGSPSLPIGQAAPVPSNDSPVPVGSPQGNDLIDLKQQALQHLSPLVSHLDQTPEEKFRTTMMLIQASDDQSLIKAAYESAQLITDDKARAQALLDVINEINYFTQHTTA